MHKTDKEEMRETELYFHLPFPVVQRSKHNHIMVLCVPFVKVVQLYIGLMKKFKELEVLLSVHYSILAVIKGMLLFHICSPYSHFYIRYFMIILLLQGIFGLISGNIILLWVSLLYTTNLINEPMVAYIVVGYMGVKTACILT